MNIVCKINKSAPKVLGICNQLTLSNFELEIVINIMQMKCQ